MTVLLFRSYLSGGAGTIACDFLISFTIGGYRVDQGMIGTVLRLFF
jgi:hypothetical protein